jgi:RNA polymerase sigma-70 factor (ECF subfamily)
VNTLVLGRPILLPPCRKREDGAVSWLRDRIAGERGSQADSADPDAELVVRLRAGDEDAFAELIDRYGVSMLRVARLYVRDRAVAEEVVQETWLAVLNGIERFEGRSSLKTWLFRILSNRAKTRGEREGRSVPFSAIVATDAAADGEASVDADRFQGADAPQWPYHWSAPPRSWTHEKVLERETLGVVRDAISELPDTQREVIRLRDVEGWSADEVAEALEISDVNQRVLLHRARSRVRAALEGYLNPEPEMT